MSYRNDILTAITSEIQEKIKVSRDYNSDIADCKRGIYTFQDCSIFPAVFFWNYRDEALGAFANQEERLLHIYIYGYVKINNLEDNDDIHNLASDIEYFLYNEFSLTGDTEVGDFIVYESGDNASGAMFEGEFTVKYYKDTLTH